MEQRNIENCPICKATAFTTERKVIDHMITKEEFSLQRCSACGFLFTNPVPTAETIGAYYKSEDYVSHSSSKKGIINRLYNTVRSYTLGQKTKLLGELSSGMQGKELLDIGSGTGHFLNAGKNKGYAVLGLEPDDEARAFAKQNFALELQGLEVLHQLESESKDIITMWHVLEHVYDFDRDTKRIAEILKPGGKWLIAVPNHESFDAQYYGSYWAAYDVPRHLYHFRKKDIENLAANLNLKLEKVLPMKFDSFYVSMLSEKYKGGSLLKAFWIGLKSNLRAKKSGGYSSQIYILSKEV